MTKTLSRPVLNRRRFLTLLAASGALAAGGYGLYSYAPWLDYEEQASLARRPLAHASTRSTQMREIVRYAALAANGHNTQPWKFYIQENAIEIHPDYSRRLAAVDPGDRELWMSLGCALENLIVAARAVGYDSHVIYPDAADFIHVRLTKNATQSGAMFDAIPLRQSTRSVYDGQTIPSVQMNKMQALPLEPGIALHFVTTPTVRETVLEYVNQGNLIQYADKAYLDELMFWLRFNRREALASYDGLYSLCAGNPEAPRWLGKMFVARTKPQQQADADARKLRSSPGAVVIASESEDRAAWVRTGQVYERLALTMTSLNIKSAFLNQPIEAVKLRSQFQSAMGLGRFLPQLLVRFGYAKALPRSLRRPVEQTLIRS